jgi:hypothetical protein
MLIVSYYEIRGSAGEDERCDGEAVDLSRYRLHSFVAIPEELAQRQAHGFCDFFCRQAVDIAQTYRVVEPTTRLRSQIEYLMQHQDDRFHRVVDAEILAQRDSDPACGKFMRPAEQSQHVAYLRVSGTAACAGMRPGHAAILTK